MVDINSSVYSSAVMCLSPTTEAARNKLVDTVIIEKVAIKALDAKFTVEEIYHSLQQELPFGDC